MSGIILPNGALQRMEERALRESWTVDDCRAAAIQALLLTYKSTADAGDMYGSRYVDSAPEDYVYNCPWNDWNPPSKATLQTSMPGVARDLVRAILCTSLDQVPSHFVFRARRHKETRNPNFSIVFASVDQHSDGSRGLILRRGGNILACVLLHTLHCTFRERGVVLAPRTGEQTTNGPKVCLKFESDDKLSKFRIMVLAHPLPTD